MTLAACCLPSLCVMLSNMVCIVMPAGLHKQLSSVHRPQLPMLLDRESGGVVHLLNPAHLTLRKLGCRYA